MPIFVMNIKTNDMVIAEQFGVKEVKEMAKEMMHKTFTVGGKDFNMAKLAWSFSFNDNKRRFGVCRPRRKSIELSKWLIENSERPKPLD